MSVKAKSQVILAADLRMQRVERSKTVQDITISTSGGGEILVASTGSLPRGSWRDFKRAKSLAISIVRTTGQRIIVQHNGRVLSEVSVTESSTPTVSVRWLRLLKEVFFAGR